MHAYFKKITAGLNIALLAMTLYMFMESGTSINGDELVMVMLMIVAPAFTLFTLFAPEQ